MKIHVLPVFIILLLAGVGAPATPTRRASASAFSLEQLANRSQVSYERFTLSNGLRVLVHTDRKAPIVAVRVYYDVGSKQESEGKAGYAHLFEHLMFAGSENADQNFYALMQRAGATDTNAETSYDSTTYYETVPTGALEFTLYLESDRMGHLLGAIDQSKLDNQRSVVKNEKRQSDNIPFALVKYREAEVLFPANHPYGHTTIGSMADLDKATMDDMRAWFIQHYAPNNAVVALVGDIDVATAKHLITKYFGDIPKGPAVTHPAIRVPVLRRRIDETVTDEVANTRIYRLWLGPGLNDRDAISLNIAATILGGLTSSKLNAVLVKKDQLASSANARVEQFAQLSEVEVVVDVSPGVDPAYVSKRLDKIIADFISKGPTASEVHRAAIQNAVSTLKNLEPVGGKAEALAEGLLYSGDPEKYARDLAANSASTPASVRRAMKKWLLRPTYALTVTPGSRKLYEGTSVSKSKTNIVTPAKIERRQSAPPIHEFESLSIPPIRRASLSNGVEIIYAQRPDVPFTRMSLSFDAGIAAERPEEHGVATLFTNLLKEGTRNLTSIGIAEKQEELGSSITAASSLDRTVIGLSSLTMNLAPSLDLLADITLHPAFNVADIKRLRQQQAAQIDADSENPSILAVRVLMSGMYGPQHPYGRGPYGTKESVNNITRDEIVSFYHRWFRPNNLKIFVVSDLPFTTLEPMLEARFGDWQGVGPAGLKSLDSPVPEPRGRIILIDRKGATQSVVVGGMVLNRNGTDDNLNLEAGLDVVGGGFLSRINIDIRETKGWSYGVHANFCGTHGRTCYWIYAPVQSDRTGAAIAAIRSNFHAFLSTKGVNAEELERVKVSHIQELPSIFETAVGMLQAMKENELLGRPDDYYSSLPWKIRGLTAAALNDATRQSVDPAKFTWVVIGDAAKVATQLNELGLPVLVVRE